MRIYDRPGKTIVIDIVVLRNKSPDGTIALLTILDAFSHKADACCLKNMTAISVATGLFLYCTKEGVPEEIRSDNGQNLNVSKVVSELYKLFGIKNMNFSTFFYTSSFQSFKLLFLSFSL